jgi:serine/threonine protein kinase
VTDSFAAHEGEALHCPYCAQLHPEDHETCPVSGETILLDGKYRLKKLLGAGSYGLVWDARNIDTKKDVAIKSLRAEVVSDPVVLSRFFWEATAAGRVHDPHVCDVIDLVKSSAHGPYIVLERLSGRSLESLIQEWGRLDLDVALPLLRQALLGLEAVHRAGIVHRDVKPENIYLHEAAEGRVVVKLLDFGISKFSPGGGKTAVTGADLFMGTPEYMSPEQARGAGQVDRRTDIWALGAILYRALSGVPPFSGPDVPSVLTAILHSPHVPLAQVAPHVPAELSAVVDRCLRKEREDRYASCADLSAALEPFMSPGLAQTMFDVRARPPSAAAPRAAARTRIEGDARPAEPDAPARAEPPRRILLSCNVEDRRWFERLRQHLQPRLAGSSLVLVDAHDPDDGALEADAAVRAVVLLVSPQFLGEEFVPGTKLYAFTLTAHARGVPVLWVPVRRGAGEVEELHDFQVLGDPARPLDPQSFAEAEATLEQVCDRLVAELGGPWAPGRPPALDGAGDLEQQLEAMRARRARLEAAGQDTRAVREEINAIRRLLRMGRPLHHGDVLDDRFVVLEQLGTGGFATVWRALDQSTGAPVALKVLHAQHTYRADRRERFFRGARIMAQLQHPNIVRIVEPWASDGEYEFFAMQYVSGSTLRDAVLGGRLTSTRRMEVLLAVADALAFAHARGVVHRDVKPSNILVGDDGTPYLSDFDLVRTEDTTGGTNGGLGTVIYAAPEMMERAAEADARADVYGLGMTLAFLFHERDLTMEVIRNTDRLVDELAVPEAIRMVIRTAITWNRDHRFRTAGEFRAALAAAMQRVDLGVPAPPPALPAPPGADSMPLGPTLRAPPGPPRPTPPSDPGSFRIEPLTPSPDASDVTENSALVRAFTAIAKESDKLGDLAVSEVFASLEVHEDDGSGARPIVAEARPSTAISPRPDDDLTVPDLGGLSPATLTAIALGVGGVIALIWFLVAG